ncbi:HTH domain-containing protein [Shewanella electrodiphila]|uniref:HTH domain-containing protein n=1 Tax=Shewanella electrodiphila TaxID=934143 RepID=A0ABT0KVD5_9GAMM|nr:helix-turn-helix domain-containing protein [Shewanella electrodiphila]MCL1047531.1 HTH domain-containing protein [Shewanella electrodiphila]
MTSTLKLKGTVQVDFQPLITIKQMSKKLDISRSTLYRRVKAGLVIAPVKRNNRTIGWDPELIQAYTTT